MHSTGIQLLAGKLGFLGNKIGLYVYWQDANGNDRSKVGEWK